MVNKIAEIMGNIVGRILVLFISAGLILWAWDKVAVPYFNAPILTYWEMVAVRVALGTLGRAFAPTITTNENKKDNNYEN